LVGLLKTGPLVSYLSLYDIRGTPGVMGYVAASSTGHLMVYKWSSSPRAFHKRCVKPVANSHRPLWPGVSIYTVTSFLFMHTPPQDGP